MRLLEIITKNMTYHMSVKDKKEELQVIDDLNENRFIKLVYLDEKIEIEDIEEIRCRDWAEVI